MILIKAAGTMRAPMLPLFHARGARARLLPIVALSLLAAACTGGGSGPPEPVAQLSFAETIRVVAAQGEAPPSARDEAQGIAKTITDWYQAAFVDPDGWKDPEFPDVVRLFAGEANDQVKKELEAVTIGKGRDEVRRVTPMPSTLSLTLYVDRGGAPAYAVADVAFEATGALKESGPPLRIQQKGVYYLRRGDGGAWKIFSYQARAEQTQTPAPPASPSPGRST